jgi:hypothetical protein
MKISHFNVGVKIYLLSLLFVTASMSGKAQADTWIQKSDFGHNSANAYDPTARSGAVSFSINGKGYVGTGQFDYLAKKDFWELDPVANTWTQKADFGGTKRSYAVGFSIGSKGYIGTGIYILTCYQDFWEYDPISNMWTQKAAFEGVPRGGAVGFSINGKGYIGTGDNGSVNGLKDFWEYDPIADDWQQKEDLGGLPIWNAVGFSIDGKGYIGTGREGVIGETQSFWQYDPVNDSWMHTAAFPGAGRFGAVGFSVGNKGYVGTGSGNSIDQKDFWEYDPNNNMWAQKADYGGSPCDHAVGFSIDGKGYIGSGVSGWESQEFWEYDVNNNSWSEKAKLGPTARYSAVGFSIGGKGYIGTGFIDAAPTYAKDLWEYDPVSDTWIQKADLPGAARGEAIGFSINNKGYIGTGSNPYVANNGLKDFWEYDPIANIWVQKADFGGGGRYLAVGFSIGSKGYSGTGTNTGLGLSTEKDFWEYDPLSDLWSQKEDVGGVSRADAVGFSIGDKGYIGTGYTADLNGYLKDFWQYDPTSDTWIQKTDFAGSARSAAVGFSINNTGYLGCGYNTVLSYGLEPDFYAYDAINDSWNQVADIEFGIYQSVGFSIGNNGYVGTGRKYDPDGDKTYLNDFWQYKSCDGGDYYYADADSDGFGDANNPILSSDCIIPSGYVEDSTDCDDTNAAVYPAANEVLNNNIDDNCDGYTDEFAVGTASINLGFPFSISPNPVQDLLSIKFSLDRSSTVVISLYQLDGRKVSTIMNEYLEKGNHFKQYSTVHLCKGMYTVQLITGDFRISTKLVIQ